MARSIKSSSPDGSSGRGAGRFTAIMGLAAVAAWVVGFVLATSPSVDAPAVRQAAYFDDNYARLLVCLVLFEIGAALLIGFFVGLWQLLRKTDPSVGPLAAMGAAAG